MTQTVQRPVTPRDTQGLRIWDGVFIRTLATSAAGRGGGFGRTSAEGEILFNKKVSLLFLQTKSNSNLTKLEHKLFSTITEANPEAIIITSPSIYNLSKNLSKKFNIQIIEGITAATSLMENFAKLDLQIKKIAPKPSRNFGIPI